MKSDVVCVCAIVSFPQSKPEKKKTTTKIGRNVGILEYHPPLPLFPHLFIGQSHAPIAGCSGAPLAIRVLLTFTLL